MNLGVMGLTIKRWVKQLTPPIIWGAIRRLFVYPTPFVTYEGNFVSFEDVYRKYPVATNYHSATSEVVEYNAAAQKLTRFELGDLPEYDSTLPRLNFLPTLLCLYRNQEINILDVGGGLGVAFIDLMYFFPNKVVSVKVLELPSIVSRGRELFNAHPGISFVDCLPDVGERFDVVYFGSSLQYFEDYRGMLDSVIGLGSENIVISDTTMGEAAAFVAAQVNMPSRVIPRMVFNLAELVQLFSSNDYYLLHKSQNHSILHDFSNYNEAPISATGHWNLVFGREAS